MLLNTGPKATDDDCEDPSDLLLPDMDDNFDDLDNVMDDLMDHEAYNEMNLNCNGDVSKIAINDILNEMRMNSPIENDLLSDLFYEEHDHLFHQFGNNDVNVNINPFENDDFNQINFENAEPAASDNLLDNLLKDESCSSSDVQVEFDDAVQFQYDVSDQFNCEPEPPLLYQIEPDSTTLSIEDASGLNCGPEIGENYDHFDDFNFSFEPEPELDLDEAETVPRNQYFHCSTALPMTHEELQEDIQQYLNTEQNYSYDSFYEYADMINATNDNQSDVSNFPYSSEILQEYIDEQNQLIQSPDPVSPHNPCGSPSLPTNEGRQQSNVFQCNNCGYFSSTLHGLNVHTRVHMHGPFGCDVCGFSTTSSYNLRQHHAYDHGNAFCCEICNFVTHSSSKIKSHMRKEH